MPSPAVPGIDELWKVDFGEPHPGEPAEERPALILGPDNLSVNPYVPVILVPLTTTSRSIRTHIAVDSTPETGLDYPSYIQCEYIRSVARDRLRHRTGTAGPEVTYAVRAVLRALLGIPAPVT